MPLTLVIPASLGRVKAAARAELLVDAMTRWLDEPVTVLIADSYEDMEHRIATGEADLAWAPPGVCAACAPSARAIFTAVRQGKSTFWAAVIVHQNGPETLADLRGSIAAWNDPGSMGGCRLARARFAAEGFAPETFFAEERYLGSYKAALSAVITGEAAVCSVYCNGESLDAARESIHNISLGFAKALRPLVLTEAVPADGLVVGAALSEEFVASLTDKIAEPVRGTYAMILDLLDAEGLIRSPSDAWASLV